MQLPLQYSKVNIIGFIRSLLMKSESKYKGQFYILSTGYFLFFLGFNSIIPELPSFLRSLNGGQYLGYIISLFALSAMLTRPISGKLSDQIGRKPIMILGAIIGAVVLATYPIFPFVFGFLMLRFAHGLSAGFLPTAAATAVADLVPANKMAKYMGLVGMFASVGMAMGPVLGSWIALHHSIQHLFYFASFITALSLVFVLIFKESHPSTTRFNIKMLYIKKEDVFDKKVSLPALIMVLTILGFGTILTLIPDLSDHLGIKNRGTFFFIFTVASVSIRVVLSNKFDKYDRVSLLKIGSGLLSISLLLLALASQKIHFYILAASIGIAAGINSPVLFAWTIDVADAENKSRAISTLFISLELGILIGAYTGGAIFDTELQNYTIPLLIGGISALIAFIILQFMVTKK